MEERIERRNDIRIEIQVTHVQMEVLHEATSSGVHLVFCADFRIVSPVGVHHPPMGGYFPRRVHAGGDILPEAIEVRRSGKNPAHTDDGNGGLHGEEIRPTNDCG